MDLRFRTCRWYYQQIVQSTSQPACHSYSEQTALGKVAFGSLPKTQPHDSSHLISFGVLQISWLTLLVYENIASLSLARCPEVQICKLSISAHSKTNFLLVGGEWASRGSRTPEGGQPFSISDSHWMPCCQHTLGFDSQTVKP